MQVIVFTVGLNESHGLPTSHCWLNDLSLRLASYSVDYSVFSFSIFLFLPGWAPSKYLMKDIVLSFTVKT